MQLINKSMQRRLQQQQQQNLKQTGCDIAIIHILLKIANLSHDIEQKSNRTFEFEHLTVQAQIILWTFGIRPQFMSGPFGVSVEFRVFETLDGILETSLHQIAARS